MKTFGVRFAPSPTGAFHLGNLRTAWFAWRFAQKHSVPLSIRWEDIDRERSKPSWIEIQKNDLKKIGIIWQQEFLQSENHHRHREAFDVALKRGQVYPCFCTRQEVQNAVQALASAPQRAGEQRVYSGACRNLTSAEVEAASVKEVLEGHSQSLRP
jgi:glutamyl-tRNA synthetase